MTLAVDRNEQVQHLRGTRPPYDAVSEVWWSNARELEAAMRSPELEALWEHLFRQGEALIDLSRSTLFFAQEQAVVEADDRPSPAAHA